MPKVFSQQTLAKFEDASAGIPVRPLDRAFDAAGIRLGKDPGGSDGVRKARFRRYLASIDQSDRRQLDQLGDALGAMIAEVATSKQQFLIQAAERDGFVLAEGAFRPVRSGAISFAVSRVEDLALIGERGRRLDVLANDNPTAVIGGAKELVESVCLTILRLIDKPEPAKSAGLVDIARSTLKALDTGSPDIAQQLVAVVAGLGESHKARSSRHARLAVGAAVAFAGFVRESYAERALLKKR